MELLFKPPRSILILTFQTMKIIEFADSEDPDEPPHQDLHVYC